MPHFLTNCWQVAAFADEVIAPRPLARRLLDQGVVIIRTSSGVVAMEDRCPHRSAPLSKGTQIGDTLQCGYHGLRFAADGRCIAIPGQATIPSNANVRTFPVVERHRLIWIWMGDASKANETTLPNVQWMESDDWVVATGYHLIAADYRLLTDNLLDLSHETYLHVRTIGNDAVADTSVTTRSDNNGVYVTKEIEQCSPPPFYQYLGNLPAETKVKRWQRTRFEPPSYTVIDVGVEALEFVPGSNRVEGRVINLITPATATTSHYFWAFARNFRLDEPEVTHFLRNNVGRTFDEDKEMLEAQQANLGNEAIDPRYKVVTKNDAAPLQARRMLEARMSSDAPTTSPGDRSLF
jgi:phenylpropionate dioxygenase-like ring-hydroxylating dioxygenase large terminal subunit